MNQSMYLKVYRHVACLAMLLMNTSKYDFVFNESKLNKMILSDLKHDFRSHVALQALSSPNFDTFDIIPLHLTEYK